MNSSAGSPPRFRIDAVAYLLTALFGVVLVLRIFPLTALDGTLTLIHPVVGDPAQHIIGQRYFLADAWRWPPLVTRLIEPPRGVNIALTDSIPLAALIGRLFAALLPRGGHFVYGWVALCYVLQPVCAVFALRSAGLRGIVPLVAGGVIAVCMPAFIFRVGHAALCAHFTILLAIGLYFRMVAAPRGWWWLPGCLLIVGALLIHPYLMVMTVGVLAAAPLSLLARGQPRPAMALGVRLFAAFAVLGGVAALCGYLGAETAGGFGYYSLNLLEPFLPVGSTLIGGFALPDATGGQFEGFSYLGLGLMALLLVALAQLRLRAVRVWLGQHAGLFVITAGASVFAISDTVYLGHHLLAHLPIFPDALKQFRASGRFVWIGLYVALVAAVVLVSKGLGWRGASAVLVAAALLQYADTRDLRGQVSGQLRRPTQWAIDPAVYRPLLASHQMLTIWPTDSCDPQLVNSPVFMHLLLLSSEVAVPVNTVPTARSLAGIGCDPGELTRPTLLPGELRLLLPGSSPNLVASLPGLRGLCHALPGGMVGCTAGHSLDGDPVVTMAPFLLGQMLSLGEPNGARLRGLGWTDASADGAWSIGPAATLTGALPAAPGALRLSVVAHGLARAGAQTVGVQANGHAVATWQVTQGADATYTADLPADIASDGTLTLSFDIAAPVAPNDVMGNGDLRLLGLFLRSFRLDPS